MRAAKRVEESNEIEISMNGSRLKGNLTLPEGARGIVLFVHGSGSGKKSPRNQFVADKLNQDQIGTLLFDLLTEEEESVDNLTRQHRFDIPLLTSRLVAAIDWVKRDLSKDLKMGLFGASTGAAAALKAAAERPDSIFAVVSRGGRPDLAGDSLARVYAPTLLIVGGDDPVVLELNEKALKKIPAEKRLIVVPHASHLFEEPGKLEEVTNFAQRWFSFFLTQTEDKQLFLDLV